MTDQIKTPAHIVVIATCPSCSLQQALGVHLNAELIVSDEGSVLALKAKASKAEHVCGQLSFEESAIVQPLLDLAGKHGPITIEHKGRSVTLAGLAYSALVDDGETLDQALVRLEQRADYQDAIGSEAGQALLQAIQEEGGAFVPFLTEAQLTAAGEVPA